MYYYYIFLTLLFLLFFVYLILFMFYVPERTFYTYEYKLNHMTLKVNAYVSTHETVPVSKTDLQDAMFSGDMSLDKIDVVTLSNPNATLHALGRKLLAHKTTSHYNAFVLEMTKNGNTYTYKRGYTA